MVRLSHQLESNSQMSRERPRETGNTGVIHPLSAYIDPRPPLPLTSNLHCFTRLPGLAGRVCDVAPMKCDKQEYTVWISWAALQWTGLLIMLTASLSGMGISLFSIFIFYSHSKFHPSIHLSVRTSKHTHSVVTWLWMKAAGHKLKSLRGKGYPLSCNYDSE